MFEGIVIGVWTFWGILLFLGIVFGVSYRYSSAIGVVLSFAAAVALLVMGPTVEAFSWMVEHPFWTALGVVGYIVIGGIYSIGKWKLYLSKPEVAEELKKQYDRWKALERSNYASPLLKAWKDKHSWNDFRVESNKRELVEAFENYSKEIKDAFVAPPMEEFKSSSYYDFLKLANNKGRFIDWILFWAFSIIWTFTYEFSEYLYNKLGKIYSNMTDKFVKNVLGE